MAGDNRAPSSLFRRAEQLRRWQESETNKQEVPDKLQKRKVKFSDGCVFLAAGAAGDKEELKRLLDRGADINTVNQDGITALHAACIDNNMEIVEFLVDNNADINRCDMEGWTPLHATASCGSLTMAEFLISRGADLSVVNNDGELAIDVVDEDDMAKLLQEEMDRRGVDCDASRSREERHMLEDAQYWLSAGRIMEKPHLKTGATALHVAAAKGYIKVMRILLEAESDINAKDLDGWTALHAAVHWRQTEAVEILCDHMADMECVNHVGQTPLDFADDKLKPLLDELKRKQDSVKLITQSKNLSKKRKSSPNRERSSKKERESHHHGESDGTSSSDESILHLEKPISANRDVALVDLTEVQSWRRPFMKNKSLSELKKDAKEGSKTIQGIPQVNNVEEGAVAKNDSNISEDDRTHVLASEHRQKALSCLTLSSSSGFSEEGRRETSNISITNITDHSPNHSLISTHYVTSPPLHSPPLRRTVSLSSEIFVPTNGILSLMVVEDKNTNQVSAEDECMALESSHLPLTTAEPITNESMNIGNSINEDVFTPQPLRRTSSLSDNLNVSSLARKVKDNSNPRELLSNQSKSLSAEISESSPIYQRVVKPLIQSLSTPLLSSHFLVTPSASSDNSTTSKVVQSSISSTIKTVGNHTNTTSSILAFPMLVGDSSTNTINKNPEVLARSQSLKARIQRNCQEVLKLQDSCTTAPSTATITSVSTSSNTMATSFSLSQPSSSVLVSLDVNGAVSCPILPSKSSQTLSSYEALSQECTSPKEPSPTLAPSYRITAGSVIKNFFKSFIPPSRDDESETQRKAHAKLVRSTRRSTQGITLEDVKSAEQFIKNKQVNLTTNSTNDPLVPVTQSTTATIEIALPTKTVPADALPPSNVVHRPNSPDLSSSSRKDDVSVPTWRLRVDGTEVQTVEPNVIKEDTRIGADNDTDTTTVTIPLRKKGVVEDKKEEKNLTTREGTQAVIQRRKKAKRRSTGVVHVDMDEIDPDKKANKETDNQSDDKDDDQLSASDKETTSANGSHQTAVSRMAGAARNSSLGAHNGDIDYKKLYEEQLAENDKLMERLHIHERELRQAKETIDSHAKTNNAKSQMAETERREKRAVERKLSEMEEELRELDHLRQENQRLKDENGALIRVISKLSR